ncbi:MAG: GDP-mannose 4,6-dehydratase [Pseudomonadota bacterium]|nr:GDP-mannose 4,6-dehydratase [Pseudomonadota bacterium]
MTSEKKNVLLLGGTGFAGRHMVKELEDCQVFAYGKEVDVRDRDALRTAVAQSQPEWVIFFASITTVRESLVDPKATYEIAFTGMLNLLTILKDTGFSGKVLQVSSSEVYGHPTPEELPLRETSSLRPMSPYSVAKLAAEFLSYQWWRSDGLEIVTARPFTHVGPGQSDRFAISNFSRQIAEIKLGRREPVMRVGDLSTTRDITDVRDTVRAYRMLLESGKPGEVYNVCSGVETSLKGMLDSLVTNSKQRIKVETDTDMLRAKEQQHLCGSYEKLQVATGWRPVFGLERTLTDTLDDWLRRLS